MPFTSDVAQNLSIAEKLNHFYQGFWDREPDPSDPSSSDGKSMPFIPTIHSPVYTCANREPAGYAGTALAFLPVLAAELSMYTPEATYYGGECFDWISFNFEIKHKEVDIVIVTKGRKRLFCEEAIVFGNIQTLKTVRIMFEGEHTLKMPIENND